MTYTIVHISTTDGHHPSYRDTFARLLAGEASTGAIFSRCFWRLLVKKNVLFATIDADYFGFVVIALLRALQGKSTTGIFLRALQCFRSERKIVYPIKRICFTLLCKVPRLKILSIIPHSLHPELKEVSHDWIYDPQMWDLWITGQPVLPDTDLSREVEAKKGDRKVLIFIGEGNKIKGFHEFLLQAERNLENFLIVVAGTVANEFKIPACSLKNKGVIIVDRYVTENEILSLYKVADLAWCKYATNYDQASGVFGRALQTGVSPIVREGSLIDRMLKQSPRIQTQEMYEKSMAAITTTNR
ncbi:glycosyltransferase [Hydrogenophaga taeniospiralis]|uniref:glycosyltransferase n=1 Tax=Hydrogenophaga taeniospiralis TaxID=65656 RepID=UPI001CFA12E5|nr:glycosyltransferase [Hydrogenophaga taeniospiralis]UCU92214.1 hypothetical protein KI616_15220 [Hydrogenophaga taeniospiralis]